MTKKAIRADEYFNLDLSIEVQHNLTEKQEKILETSLDKATKCLILDGLAGTSKTWLCALSALRLLEKRQIKQIIYLRSTVQSKDGQLGYLPGEISEKTHYYNEPFLQILEEFISPQMVKKLVLEERLKFYPTSMLRSYNFKDSVVIADESQSMLFSSIISIATRLSPYSRLFVIGDSIYQNDLGKTSGFKQFINLFSDDDSREQGFRYFKLDSSDIVRSPFVKFIMEKIEKFHVSNYN